MIATQVKSPTSLSGEHPVPLESVLYTEELSRRPSRSPDYEKENRALAKLVQALADSPGTILQSLADTILEVFQADSAGLSLLTTHDGGKRFYWPAIAGAWKPHVGGGTPRDFGPCGDVLDCNAPLLFKHFERRYPYLLPATPPAEEALLIPFHVNGKAVGTIWAMAHNDRRRFDAEDLRQLESLGRFASAAYQAVHLPQANDSRRAALNLMEDAVQARQATERVNAELRENERRFREMIDALPAAIYTTDAKGHLTHFNRAAIEFSGRTPQLGTDEWCVNWKLYRADGTPLPHEEWPLAIALKEGRIVRGAEAIAERPDGTRVWFEPYPTPLRNSGGEIAGGINMLVDITERKRAGSLIQCQKESLEMLVKGESLEQVLDFLARSMESQSQGGFAVAIHLMEADGYHFGYVAAPSLPASYAQATKGMDARLELGPCSSAVVSHEPTVVRDFAAQERWRAFSAEVVSLGLRGCFTTPILSSDQRVLGTFAIYYREPRDPGPHDQQVVDLVTSTVALAIERKQAEEALEAAERRFHGIFESVAVSLWEEDFTAVKSAIDGLKAQGVADFARYFQEHPEFVQRAMGLIRVRDVNDATVEMFEAKDKSELLGSLPKIFVPESMPVFVGELIALAEGRTYFEAEALLNTVRGNPVYVFFTMVLPGANEPYDRVLFSVVDISERRAMEEQIRQQAEQIADESRRKDEFLAMLSHELRNPLAPIRSAVYLLKMHERGSENAIQRQAREIIERQTDNLTKLVSDLLEVSRVVSGRIRLNQQTVDMNQIVRHAIETAKPLIEQRKHELLTHPCDEPLWSNVDPTRLEEVIINILNNAAKYTPDGGRIEIWCERPPGDNAVQVRVRDNGTGIEKELLPRIFDLFTQADRSLARSAGGLGIGLSLAYRLVDLHGGTIEAHSPPEGSDVGSEFIVKLPLMAALPELGQPEAPTAETPQDPGGVRVLVVDDNIDLVMMLASSLRKKGYSVQSAYTGPDGLKIAQQWRPEVVLLDIGLPGLDGHEVAKRLRSDPTLGKAGAQMRLIALTGYGRDTDIARASEAGFDAHLVKPYEFDELEKLMVPQSKPRQ